MYPYKIIDSHTHIYPAKIASKAIENVGSFYSIEMKHDGLPRTLHRLGKEINVSKQLVFSVATTPAQVCGINRFILEKCAKYRSFVPVGALHKDFENFKEEISFLKETGFAGIKFHPDLQRFNIDDPSIYPLYSAAAEAGLAIIFHMGDERVDFSSPERLARAAADNPDMRCVAAHFGGYRKWEDSKKFLSESKNIYFDTSSSLAFIEPAYAKSLIDNFGAERILFATDFPMWDPAEELERFLAIDLSEREREMILSNNAERFFNITL